MIIIRTINLNIIRMKVKIFNNIKYFVIFFIVNKVSFTQSRELPCISTILKQNSHLFFLPWKCLVELLSWNCAEKDVQNYEDSLLFCLLTIDTKTYNLSEKQVNGRSLTKHYVEWEIVFRNPTVTSWNLWVPSQWDHERTNAKYLAPIQRLKLKNGSYSSIYFQWTRNRPRKNRSCTHKQKWLLHDL